VKADLKKMGYKLNERNGIGRTEVIKIVNGKLQTAADKRGDDSVAGH
jgi:gamma-glutamyltranspeptidase/glutathione hydrolase